ncbi:MAG: tyrosine-protein phosphatase [Phycisphaerae bacterium]
MDALKPEIENQAAESPSPARPHKTRRRLTALAAVVVLAAGGCLGYRNFYLFYDNFHTVVPGQVYRCDRPNPSRLAEWSRTYGIKTSLNLEGGDEADKWYLDNARAKRELGIMAVDIKLATNRLPTADELHHIIRTIETAPRPLLINCRAGSERTGMASVIAAMAVGGQDYKTARGQLSAKYLHFYHGSTRAEGVADQYEEYCRANNLDTGGWPQFRRWAMDVYKP